VYVYVCEDYKATCHELNHVGCRLATGGSCPHDWLKEYDRACRQGD